MKSGLNHGARQMSNKGVKQCQANEGADSKVTAKAGNDVQCARGQDGISWALQIIAWEILKVSDDKVTPDYSLPVLDSRKPPPIKALTTPQSLLPTLFVSS